MTAVAEVSSLFKPAPVHTGLQQDRSAQAALHIPYLLTAQKDGLQSEHGAFLYQHLLPLILQICPTEETPHCASYDSRHLSQHP